MDPAGCHKEPSESRGADSCARAYGRADPEGAADQNAVAAGIGNGAYGGTDCSALLYAGGKGHQSAAEKPRGMFTGCPHGGG